MIFASSGGNIQKTLMAVARKRAFMFDSSITPEAALTDPVAWVKNMVEARSIGYSVADNKLLGCSCSGIASQYFFPAEVNHDAYERTVNNSPIFSMSDTLTAQQRALKHGVMSYLNADNSFANPLAGPVSLSAPSAYDTYNPSHLPVVGTIKTVLIPKKYASLYGVGGHFPDRTGTYNSSGSGSNNSWSYTYFASRASYGTEDNSYAQGNISFGSSSIGNIIRLFGSAPVAGMASVYGVQNYIYNTLVGNNVNTWTYSRPGNVDVPLQHKPVVKIGFASTAPADTPAFDIEWLGCPIWNGEKISCEIFRKGTDFKNNVQQQTNVEPDVSFLQTLAVPGVASVISV
ncbi:hypothetical protein pEaSNUABM14_00097 [Erwinia phage pEa_SNUABM_14]|nr:hypothetical protein pEaSNUABM13_00098 [Erwinia phage pEa_SNUABM_13]QYW03398.1 hypothetical protein pEaSNUABM34_00096 [Erwinia phage pEa_SNUABM_34]QYW03740.1 hypothetical protein pEaSNUABM45_00097 [Erwinia phage pEa_SNUABM_45]QYW04422.1 hypothetical protein pEaSNUABM14_00097 [Erwinia phage pEa_SNUABM_14]QYW05111.1 hypothetical protein pEaSNUABM21_00097 [Erwinia phage pEa_SNUABM_21]QYW05453.1 hypothetical protein pEaSNUABM25_00097 [Erwinia phage pEa_SNUABM_25]